MLRRPTPRRAVVTILLCGALLAGCDDGDESREDREADAYIVVIEWVLAEPQFAPDPTLVETPPLFIESLAPGEIDLDAQVEIVAYFEPAVDIRFIDARTEALEESEIGQPVRNGGLLLGLGALPVEGPIEIRGEVYRTADDVVAYRFQVGGSGGTMRLIAPPEQVEPEGLVGEL